MPIRGGEEFLASIRDGREVWLDGERGDDVTTHPGLAGCARALAEVFDLQHDPAYQDLLTIESPTTGERVSRGYALPRSVEELVRRREMIEYLMESLDLEPQDVYVFDGPLNVQDLMALYDANRPDLKDEPFSPSTPEWFESYPTIFDAIKERDRLLHHPYDSYECVTGFINQAADDEDHEMTRASSRRRRTSSFAASDADPAISCVFFVFSGT